MARLARLVLALFLVTLSPAQAFWIPNTPEDLQRALETLHEQGVVASSAYFRPDELLNRAEAVTLLLRVQPVDYVRDVRLQSPWIDVPKGSWYANYVAIATQLGMVKMNPEGRFYPDRPITRAEFIEIMFRLDKLVGNHDERALQVAKYADTKPGDWFYTSSLWAKGSFLASYVQDGFNGGVTITRQEAALLMYRYWLVQKGPSSAGWNRPFGDILYPDTSAPTALLPIVQYQGPDLAYLPTTVYVYKEVIPAPIEAVRLAIPEVLHGLVPYLGDSMPLRELQAETVTADGRRLRINFTPTYPFLSVVFEDEGSTGKGSYAEQALRMAKKLGVDTRRYEAPQELSESERMAFGYDAVFPQLVDGLYVYDTAGRPEAALRFTRMPSPRLDINLRQLALRGEYQALSWKDTLQQMQQHVPAGAGTLILSDAAPVMIRVHPEGILEKGLLPESSTFLVPGIHFTGMLSGRSDGQLDTPVSFVYPRVGAFISR